MTYRIKLHPSNLEFVAEANESILDAGLRQGVMLPYGCRGGVCGSCAATILSGLVHYPFGEAQGLAPFDEERGKAFLCLAAAASDLDLEVAHIGRDTEIEVKTLPVRVEKMRKLAPDVMELTLKLPASERLRFFPGQYIDILLKDGTRRGFSLANAPFNDQLLELHIRHVPNGKFTSYVFNDMQEKALLRIEGPLGGFYIHDSEHPLILMGGGTGFAPLKSMLEQLIEAGLTRPVYLYWGARAKVDLYMDAVLRSWVARHPLLNYVPVLSAPKADEHWQGRTGYVHAAVASDFPDLSGYEVYMSGPPPMINAAKPAFLAQGLLETQLYSDAFEYSADTLNAIKAGAAI
jgi:CDP-4-dehydro-6-deoxyglucose reductase